MSADGSTPFTLHSSRYTSLDAVSGHTDLAVVRAPRGDGEAGAQVGDGHVSAGEPARRPAARRAHAHAADERRRAHR